MTPQSIWEKINPPAGRGVFVVAEAGKNFIETEEDQPVAVYLENAERLARLAKDAGADAIKFQTHDVEDEILNIPFVSPHFPDSKSGDRHSWISRSTKATPVNEFWQPLKKYCDEIGIIFFSTPMSRGAAKRLEEVQTPIWKIGSGDILDFPLLDFVSQTGKPILLSSGMSTLEELEQAIGFLKKRTEKVALLHCVSKYPCPKEDLNLKTIEFFREQYNLPIGFSDHSLDIESALLAVSLGATILEKHFSLSRTLWGPDHKVSLTPEELKLLVREVHLFENNPIRQEEILKRDFAQSCLGSPAKVLQADEEAFRPLFRKSLMAGCDLPAGTMITAQMVYAMRPQALANGLPSERYESVLGRKCKRALKKYEPLTEEILA